MSTIHETLPETFQNLSTINQSHEPRVETKVVPHCEIHEKFYRGCINCLRARDKYTYVTQRSLPYYCDICKISIVKQYKNQHLLTEKHRTLSQISQSLHM